MAIVIEDSETIQQIEQLAAKLRVTPPEAVRAAVEAKTTQDRPASVIDSATVERRRAAILEAQEWFRLHDNKDSRT